MCTLAVRHVNRWFPAIHTGDQGWFQILAPDVGIAPARLLFVVGNNREQCPQEDKTRSRIGRMWIHMGDGTKNNIQLMMMPGAESLPSKCCVGPIYSDYKGLFKSLGLFSSFPPWSLRVCPSLLTSLLTILNTGTKQIKIYQDPFDFGCSDPIRWCRNIGNNNTRNVLKVTNTTSEYKGIL